MLHSNPQACVAALSRGWLTFAATLGLWPLLAEDSPPTLRVQAHGGTEPVTIGTPELVWDTQRKLARIPLANPSSNPVLLTLTTHCRPAEENGCGGLHGLTRGFVGVIFLGASEIDAETCVESRHHLQPGEHLMVEHVLSPSAKISEVVSTLHLGSSPAQALADSAAERESQVREQRQNRDGYHQARKKEEARWREVRGRLIALQSQCQPLTAEYKARLNDYWDALNTHKDRLKSLDEAFPTATPACKAGDDGPQQP